jgi:hypothetical protein
MKKSIILLICLCSFKASLAQWTAIDSADANTIWLVQPNNGWTFGQTFRHWDGINWTTAIQDSSFAVTTCAFTSPNDGWAFGAQDSMYRYNGAGWIKQYSGRPWITYSDFFDANNGWLLSWDTIYNYQAGIWSKYHIPLPADIPYCEYQSISSSEPNTLWITGYGANPDSTYIFKFSSGQLIVDTIFANIFLSTICFTDQNHGWVGGENSVTQQRIIYKYNGTGWHPEHVGPAGDPNAGINTLYMLSNNLGWAAADAFYISGYNGLSWTCLDATIDDAILQFSFADPLNGWALGKQYWPPTSPIMTTIYSTSTGGAGIETDISANIADLDIFPNPATDKISIVSEFNQTISLSIFNMVGMLILKKELFGTDNEIDISAFPTGMYLMQVTGPDRTMQKKIIKE